ncbi:MAG: hypothetical protein ACK5D7_15155 [Planctomycetota bacterium]
MKRKSRKLRSLFASNQKKRGQQTRQKKSDVGLVYQQLEARQMLDTTLGMNFTGHTYQTQSCVNEPNMAGDLGTTHYAEAIVDKISFFKRDTGPRDIFKTQTQFWVDAGATVSSPSITNAQVVFDRFANRWLVLGEGSESQGNWLYLAISKTANPMDGFRAVRFVGDSTGIRHNGDLAIAVDEDAVLMTTRNISNSPGTPLAQKISNSIFSVPRKDLYLTFPTLTNMTRHENLLRSVYGDLIRPAASFEKSDQKATFISHTLDGAQTLRIDLTDVSMFGATLQTPQLIDFDPSADFVYQRNLSEGVPVPDPRQTPVGGVDQFLRAKVSYELPSISGTQRVPVSSMINNVVDVGGSLWYAQVIDADIYLQTGTSFNGIVVYEINKARNELDHANLIVAPENALFDAPEEWDFYNASLAVNQYGVVVVNFTASSGDNDVNPSAANAIGITVNGTSTYNPIRDTINVPPKPWEPGNLPYRFDRPGRNTQFELTFNFPDDDRGALPDDDPNDDRDDFIQEGLAPFQNGTYALNVSSWSSRSVANFDPRNVNQFWVSTQWANNSSRWSTQITQIIPKNMRPVLTADWEDNEIVVRRHTADNNLLEVEIDGEMTDLLPFEVLGNVVINGYDGDDRFILDYSNGDPVPDAAVDFTNPPPSSGFTFNGMRGSDTVETNDPDGARFVVDGQPVNRGPAWLAYGTGAGDGSGTYKNMHLQGKPSAAANLTLTDSSKSWLLNQWANYQVRIISGTGEGQLRTIVSNTGSVLTLNQPWTVLPGPDSVYAIESKAQSYFVNVEELFGGEGDDLFLVTDNIDYAPPFVFIGYLPGSMHGNGGNDTFHFGRTGSIGDSVYGGDGFNTLSFETRTLETTATLLGYGGITGYEGRANSPDGPVGDDQVFDRFIDINYIRGSDTMFDRIVGLNFVTDVYVDDEDSYYETNGVQLGFFEVNAIDASNFIDTFVGVRNSVNPLELNGLNGNDVYYFSSDGTGLEGSTAPLQDVIFAQGGAGVNELYISNKGGPAAGTGLPALILNNRISGMGEIAYNAIGGSFNLHVWASQFADRIDLHSFLPGNTLELYLLGGNDVIDVEDLSKAFVDVYGGDGDDLYLIQKVQGVDFRNLVLHDSVGSERDRVSLRGTILNETFVVNNTTFVDTNVVYTGIEVFGLFGRGGDDTFDIESFDYELLIEGEEGNDVFNFSSNAPTNTGNLDAIFGKMTVDGGSGVNQLRISNLSGAPKNVTITSSTITGLFAEPFTYLSTGGTFNTGTGVGGITITGSDNGNDVFNVTGLNVDDTLRILGRLGQDSFTVAATALGNIQLEGGLEGDSYSVAYVGAGSRQVRVIDTTSADTLDVLATNLADTLVVASTGVTRGSEAVLIQAALSTMQVFGRDGNDKITVNGGSAGLLRVFGDNQNDELTVNGTTGIGSIEVHGNSGNDNLLFQTVAATTSVLSLGGTGDDIFNVGVSSVPNLRLDGQEGSDRYNVTFRGLGSRQVDVRDTGTAGNDVVNVMGSAGGDNVFVQTTRVELGAQAVVFDVKTERLVVNLKEGDDTLEAFGSVAGSTLFQGEAGNDKFVIHSTTQSPTMTADGGIGNDIFVVKSTEPTTRTTLYGKEGDDRFNVGSTLEDNVGNLNTIRGRVAAIGGTNESAGQDRLYVNDIIGNDAYAYNLGPTYIRALPGPNNIARPNFAGISFDETMEHVRLDGTLQPNFFSIEASKNTEFYLYGNLPSPGTTNGDVVFLRAKPNDGHQIRFTDLARGRGFISFTNGDQFIRFDNIESTFPVAPAAMPPAPSDSSILRPWGMTAPGGGSSMKKSLPPMDNLAGSIRLSDDEGIATYGGSAQSKFSGGLDVATLDQAFAKI